MFNKEVAKNVIIGSLYEFGVKSTKKPAEGDDFLVWKLDIDLRMDDIDSLVEIIRDKADFLGLKSCSVKIESDSGVCFIVVFSKNREEVDDEDSDTGSQRAVA